ncbi:MAG: hypothetical protein QOK18_4047 [Mycobacterium sp.]|nr:hypothetical protein [Mycobacterium sp.]
MVHANACLTPQGRTRLASAIIEQGWSIRRAAERFQCSPATPRNGPTATATAEPRRCRTAPAARITARLGPAARPNDASWVCATNDDGAHTASPITSAFLAPPCKQCWPATGCRCCDTWTRPPDCRCANPHRAAMSTPRRGDLIHLDIKKLGRIPDGGGHRKLGRTVGRRHSGQRGRGYALVHHAVDDHSRLAYSEILGDERKETAAAFWERARAYFAEHGITVSRVLTMDPVTVQHFSLKHWDPTSLTRRPAPTGRRPTGKWRDSTAPSTKNGPMPRPTSPTQPAQRPTKPGSITTITTDPTPASAESHPSNASAFTTCP